MSSIGVSRSVALGVLGLAALAVSAVAGTPKPATTTSAESADVFTPVVVSLLGQRPAAFPGTDGLYHLVYELELTNTKLAPATIKKIEVLAANQPSRVLATYSGKKLLASLRTLQPSPATPAVIPFDESRLFYIELTFKPGHVPQGVTHHLWLSGAANPGPKTPATPMNYGAVTVTLDHSPLPVLGPPLAGDNWIDANGCCNSYIIHRGSVQSVNGKLYDGQRFAIDYMRLNAQGELVHGDPGKVENYVDYGAKVLAVAPGTVVEVLDTLNDQPPGELPDPTTITLKTVDGNHVILDLGHGVYAFYAHLQKGSVKVHVGEHVKRGQVLGLLGNSGNTSAPHLHFQIMNVPSALGSSGLPYVLDHFKLAGQINVQKFENAEELTGHWGKRLDKAVPENHRFPLNLNIIDFPKLPNP